MELIDEKILKGLHNLMRERGVNNVNLSMFSEQQRKAIYEGYGEQFLMYNGLWFMINAVVSYALSSNINMVNKKLKSELDYALQAHDYDYASLCARLLHDEKMVEFLKNYNVTNKYDKAFEELITILNVARNKA